MRIVLCGQRAFGRAVLVDLLDTGHDVVRVVCPPTLDDRLCRTAIDRGLETRPAGQGVSADTIPDDTDLIVAAHSHDWISKKARFATRLGGIGYHPSLLPRHRGRSSVEWTIRDGDPVAGGSVYWLDDRIDAGDLAAQDWCWVLPGDDASELWRRELFPLGVRLLNQAVGDLAVGRVVRVPQDERLATFEPAMDPPKLRRPDLPELSQRLGGGPQVARTFEPAGAVSTATPTRRSGTPNA
jgi:methionyl-tRNA formyltransferase